MPPSRAAPLGNGPDELHADRVYLEVTRDADGPGRDMPPSRAAPLGNGPDELHADRVYLEVTRDADGPGKLASREPLAKRRAQPVTGVRQHTAEAHTGCYHTVDLGQGDLRLRSCHSIFDRNARSP